MRATVRGTFCTRGLKRYTTHISDLRLPSRAVLDLPLLRVKQQQLAQTMLETEQILVSAGDQASDHGALGPENNVHLTTNGSNLVPATPALTHIWVTNPKAKQPAVPSGSSGYNRDRARGSSVPDQ
jgi:hypothetical protein